MLNLSAAEGSTDNNRPHASYLKQQQQQQLLLPERAVCRCAAQEPPTHANGAPHMLLATKRVLCVKCTSVGPGAAARATSPPGSVSAPSQGLELLHDLKGARDQGWMPEASRGGGSGKAGPQRRGAPWHGLTLASGGMRLGRVSQPPALGGPMRTAAVHSRADRKASAIRSCIVSTRAPEQAPSIAARAHLGKAGPLVRNVVAAAQVQGLQGSKAAASRPFGL